ncbi:MAG: hypothetical protein ACRDE9_02760, partial [Candidatus Limnocylindria bacterium]
RMLDEGGQPWWEAGWQGQAVRNGRLVEGQWQLHSPTLVGSLLNVPPPPAMVEEKAAPNQITARGLSSRLLKNR